jgi:hypothetical protein
MKWFMGKYQDGFGKIAVFKVTCTDSSYIGK